MFGNVQFLCTAKAEVTGLNPVGRTIFLDTWRPIWEIIAERSSEA